ncbi:hypothetical protein JM654_03885 [Microbacterium oxydans]|nr:hypothetical protein [Microbacterium oxydans]
MGEIIVKDNVRYTKKDANRVDVVTAGNAVEAKVPVQDTDAWAQAEAEKARAELQAELDATRAKHEAELVAELEKRRADFERELEERRNAETRLPAGTRTRLCRVRTSPTGRRPRSSSPRSRRSASPTPPRAAADDKSDSTK